MNADTDQATPKTATSQPGQSLAALASRIALVELSTPMEQLLETRNALAFMQEQIKGLKASMDAKLMEWIESNGSIQFGTKRIYVGSKKTTRCNDLRSALEALMQECDGDWERFCDCLASDAIKHGAARTVLSPDIWDQHFTVEIKTELREGEQKPVREVIEVDERFLPKKGGKQ